MSDFKTTKAADTIALLLWCVSILPYLVFFGLMDTTDSFLLLVVAPTIPWIVLFLLLLKHKEKSLIRYWWALFSAVVCFPILAYWGFVFMCWGIGGFAS
jgi:hypothetical protein